MFYRVSWHEVKGSQRLIESNVQVCLNTMCIVILILFEVIQIHVRKVLRYLLQFLIILASTSVRGVQPIEILGTDSSITAQQSSAIGYIQHTANAEIRPANIRFNNASGRLTSSPTTVQCNVLDKSLSGNKQIFIRLKFTSPSPIDTKLSTADYVSYISECAKFSWNPSAERRSAHIRARN
jgi:hypothetical protein